MTWLDGVYWSLFATTAFLILAQFAGHPKRVICMCGASGFPGIHLNSRFMFVMGAGFAAQAVIGSYGVAGFADLGPAFSATVNGLLGGYHLRAWWKHSRRDRRKLLDKVLGVVRVTLAGLKVVPVPHAGGAHA